MRSCWRLPRSSRGSSTRDFRGDRVHRRTPSPVRGRADVPLLSAHGVHIAPSTYHAAKSRPPSARAVRDAEVAVEIRRVFFERRKGRQLYGARKVWNQLRREGIDVARCTVERLMRADGLVGARRDKAFKTTRPDPGAARPADLVQRNFRAGRPNELWIVDFTYVPTWSGTAFTAFVTDVFSRRIVGWRTAASMPTELPLDALEMALWTRDRDGEPVRGVVHHSDAGSQVHLDPLLEPPRRRRRCRVDRQHRRQL